MQTINQWVDKSKFTTYNEAPVSPIVDQVNVLAILEWAEICNYTWEQYSR